MLLVIESQAANCSNILTSQRRKKQFDLCNLVGDPVLTEYITLNDSCLGSFGNVAHSRWKKSISVVDLAILGQEANKTLNPISTAR